MILRLSFLLLTFLVTSCQNLYELPRTVKDHHVLIYCGASSKDPLDPIDKNVFLVEVAKVYNEFISRGVPADNIYVLYADAKIDKSESMLNDVSSEFLNEFKGKYKNEATVKNLIAIEDELDDKLTANSVFHLVMNAHGRVDSGGFYMHSEFDNRFIRANLINDMIEDNRGLSHVFVGSCYAGQLVKEVNEGTGYLIAGASDKGSSWLDRDNSFGRIYFGSLPQDLEPLNIPASFSKAREAFIQWGASKEKFIFNDYKTKRKDELKTLVWDPYIKEL